MKHQNREEPALPHREIVRRHRFLTGAARIGEFA